jgi:hypothetical protein
MLPDNSSACPAILTTRVTVARPNIIMHEIEALSSRRKLFASVTMPETPQEPCDDELLSTFLHILVNWLRHKIAHWFAASVSN